MAGSLLAGGIMGGLGQGLAQGSRSYLDMLRSTGQMQMEFNHRAEQKRRYEERMALERQRIAMQQAKEAFDIEAQLAWMPAENALDLYPAMAERKRALGGPGPMGAMRPTEETRPGVGPPAPMPTPSPADYLGLLPSGMEEMGPTRPAGLRMETGVRPLPEGTGFVPPEDYEVTAPPTDPGARALYERKEREKTEEEEAKSRRAGHATAGSLQDVLSADPEGTGAVLLARMEQQGIPPRWDDPALLEAAKRGAAALNKARLRPAPRERRGPAPRDPVRLPKHILDGFIRVRNRKDFINEGVEGTILKTIKGDPKRAEATYEKMVEDSINESMNRSKKWLKDQRIRDARVKLQDLRRGKAAAMKLKEWQGGADAVATAEAAEQAAQQELDAVYDELEMNARMSPSDRAIRDALSEETTE